MGNQKGRKKIASLRSGALFLYDLVPLCLSAFFVFIIGPSTADKMNFSIFWHQLLLSGVCIFAVRFLLGVYRQVWRFGGAPAYLRLIEADLLGMVLYLLLACLLPFRRALVLQMISLVAINLLFCIGMRICYQFLYQYSSLRSRTGKALRKLVWWVTGINIQPGLSEADPTQRTRIKIAIVGAGRVGSMLASELLTNANAPYFPVCFVDTDLNKVGRRVMGLSVLSEDSLTRAIVEERGIQEFVFALPQATPERRKKIFEQYKPLGCKLKIYDYPTMQSAKSGRRTLREFNIEDLLFRETKQFMNEKTVSFYRDKVVMITGAGGSIGSELVRQIAKMKPKKMILLDVYENGVYDIQQELKIRYGDKLDLQTEIVSVCDRQQLECVFAAHRPQVVLHAAAHKHVPLMEHNCCEAIRNNVFGTLNAVELSEQYAVQKFIMISTDKAVNPTNVMGATKRMCEMIVQSRTGETSFSATRFGNVLGSNGSVIPLFKRQIAEGGPITLTDKRIIRYFMTIPEASQLVLQSGARAKNHELYVLDMGEPVRILELAENMISLSGFVPYQDIDIVEVGLREGEKLYEELLIKTEELDKTDNKMIFIERDKPLSTTEINVKLEVLRSALETCDDDRAKEALKSVVPTFHDPHEVNARAIKAKVVTERKETPAALK